jgi:hypothetical protein
LIIGWCAGNLERETADWLTKMDAVKIELTFSAAFCIYFETESGMSSPPILKSLMKFAMGVKQHNMKKLRTKIVAN